jgi:hypothetical protein
MRGTCKLVVPQVGLDIRFYSFLLPVGEVCVRGNMLARTVVSWVGDRVFPSLANLHLWGTHGPLAVHPSQLLKVSDKNKTQRCSVLFTFLQTHTNNSIYFLFYIY